MQRTDRPGPGRPRPAPARRARRSLRPLRRRRPARRLAARASAAAARSRTRSTYGVRDLESGAPVAPDTLWRIYSMTKPITSVAAMMLWEEGRFELTDEISRWLPEFADVRVFDEGLGHRADHGAGDRADPGVAPAHAHVRPDLRAPDVLDGRRDLPGRRLRLHHHHRRRPGRQRAGAGPRCRCCSSPASAWGYSVATDVLGRLVEVISGQSLADFVAERIFEPLGMADARWWVDDADAAAAGRRSTCRTRRPARPRAALRFDEQARGEAGACTPAVPA